VATTANAGFSVRTYTNSASAFQVQASANNLNVFTVDTSGNQVVLGTSGSSGANGTIVFNNTTNSLTTTLTVNAATGSSKTINLPNENGTLCIQSSANCGFLVGGQNDYIQNQNASDQTANFRITGSARANTSVLTPSLDRASAAAP
jgi:hypothetical protein